MLPPNYLIDNIGAITEMYDDLHTSILSSIAQHIADTFEKFEAYDIIPTAKFKLEQLNQAGMLRADIIDHLAKVTKLSRKEIRRLMRDAGAVTRRYDDRVYKAAGIIPIPLSQSPQMVRILDAGVSKQMGKLVRLTGTIATNAETNFNRLLNVAYNKVASGAYNYQEAIAGAVDDLNREGVKIFTYASGREISIEAAVRMNVLTGINQTAAKVTEQTMDEVGVFTVRTTAHLGARNKGEGFINHESWQGKVFHWEEKANGAQADYPDFIISSGYGDVRGLCGANCRHSFGPYIVGLSPETYTKADLDEFSNKTVTYTDAKGQKKTVPYYDGTQLMRELERKVREWKKREKVKKAANIDAKLEKSKVKYWQNRLIAFSAETGIKRDYSRERVAGER